MPRRNRHPKVNQARPRQWVEPELSYESLALRLVLAGKADIAILERGRSKEFAARVLKGQGWAESSPVVPADAPVELRLPIGFFSETQKCPDSYTRLFADARVRGSEGAAIPGTHGWAQGLAVSPGVLAGPPGLPLSVTCHGTCHGKAVR